MLELVGDGLILTGLLRLGEVALEVLGLRTSNGPEPEVVDRVWVQVDDVLGDLTWCAYRRTLGPAWMSVAPCMRPPLTLRDLVLAI